MGVWSEAMKNQIIADNGSVQNLPELSAEFKRLYKTTWEISQRVLIDLAADRAPFIDQSQSLNVFIPEPNVGKMTSMHFYAWKKGLKTGMYYLRSRPAVDAIKFTVDQVGLKERLQANTVVVGPTKANGVSKPNDFSKFNGVANGNMNTVKDFKMAEEMQEVNLVPVVDDKEEYDENQAAIACSVR